jgi:hypothetical protein
MFAPLLALTLAAATPAAAAPRGHLETDDLPPHLRDRGAGVRSSMFGISIQKGQILVYPYFEYYYDENAEYAPNELGGTLDQDFRAKYRASEGLLFLGFGLSDRLALEVEAAIITAELTKSADDPTSLADRIEESGLGDVESQLRWRWSEEHGSRPELFGYFETVFPTQDEGSLIGTTDWELKLGSGAVRGFPWGTVTARAAVEYDAAESAVDLGEAAVEYLKRLAPSWRVYAGVEGTQDEIELIPELQWEIGRRALVKLNSAVGLTSKATDWAPEVGVMFGL